MAKTNWSEAIETEMVSMYQQGAPASELALMYGAEYPGQVLSMLRRRGVNIRGRGFSRGPGMVWRHGARVKSLYESGLSVHEIGREIGSADSVVKKILVAVGIKPEPRPRSRERHPDWNGGRFVNDRGYVDALSDDPRFASMRGSDGYILEHRLVMAQALGRPLKRHETVHHIDGNRRHNALSNLELRQGKHGNGVRFVCCDCGSHNVEAVALAAGEH
jgi:hypothetical protein